MEGPVKSALQSLLFSLLLLTLLSGCAATTGGGSLLHFSAKNTQEVALTPYYLSDPAEGGDHVWYMKLKISDGLPAAGFHKPNRMLAQSLVLALTAHKPASGKPFAAQSQPPIKGCAGSYHAAVDSQSATDFTGELILDGYSDDCALVLQGRVPFTGKTAWPSGETQVNMTLEALAAKIGTKSLTLSGPLELGFNLLKGEKQRITSRSRMAIADEGGVRIRLAPVAFSWDRSGQYEQQDMEGQVQVEPYGSVRLTTTSPIRILPSTKMPYEGSLRFEAANDGWIRLWFNKPGASGSFRLDGPNDYRTVGHL